MKLSKRIILITLACIALCRAVASAQTSGAISGTLLDPQGNAVAGATVKITNSGTGAERVVTSGSNGYYRAPGLPPGRYEVEGAAQGFTTETRSDLALTVAGAVPAGATEEKLTALPAIVIGLPAVGGRAAA